MFQSSFGVVFVVGPTQNCACGCAWRCDLTGVHGTDSQAIWQLYWNEKFHLVLVLHPHTESVQPEESSPSPISSNGSGGKKSQDELEDWHLIFDIYQTQQCSLQKVTFTFLKHFISLLKWMW